MSDINPIFVIYVRSLLCCEMQKNIEHRVAWIKENKLKSSDKLRHVITRQHICKHVFQKQDRSNQQKRP